MRHLKEWQRYQIAAKLEAGCTKKEIAEYLGVHPSTITREIQRNGYSRYRCYRPRKRHGFLSPNQVFSKSTGLDARVFV